MAGLTRLIRRICLLREQGDVAGAARLQESELLAALDELRQLQGPEAWRDEEVRALFAAEERRVADAMVLAEILIPKLTELWKQATPVARTVTTITARTREPDPVPAPAAAPSGPPVITDLLDAMLADERKTRRVSSASNR